MSALLLIYHFAVAFCLKCTAGLSGNVKYIQKIKISNIKRKSHSNSRYAAPFTPDLTRLFHKSFPP